MEKTNALLLIKKYTAKDKYTPQTDPVSVSVNFVALILMGRQEINYINSSWYFSNGAITDRAELVRRDA